MKLGHVLLLPLVPVALGACSDPPSAPPEAAAYVKVTRAESGTCNASHFEKAMPLDQRVVDNLNCNLKDDCKPDGIVAVDGDTDTLVSCTVSPGGTGYSVSGSFRHMGDSISVTGQVAETGGTVQMTHYFNDTGVALSGTCTLSILPNQGVVAGGRIWAHFTCPDFTDPSAAGGMDCAADGAFLFQRCDGG